MKLEHPLYAKLSAEIRQYLLQLQQILSDSRTDIWLVGGTIRDLLEEQIPKDFDFAFCGDLTPQIKRWAGLQGGRWFWLDKKRNQSRVLFTDKGLQFDFAPLRAEGIYADLKLRDFTLNAIALPFNDTPGQDSTLLDPLNGRQDLADHILRSCGPNVLSDDPLRILKGVRHHALRGWQFDVLTAQQVTDAAPLLLSVAGERLRNELGQILESARLLSSIALMDKYDILDNIFPGVAKQGLAQGLGLLISRIDELSQIPCFTALFAQSIEEGLTRRTLLLLAAIVRRVHSLTSVDEIIQRLRLSTRSREILLALHGTQVSLEGFSDSDSSRIAALKLEAKGRHCLELVLFALAGKNYAGQDLLLAKCVNAYQQQLCRGRIVDLLDGREISLHTGVPPGQIIGDYQRRIKTAEIAGEITGKGSAESWLKRQFSD